MTSTAPPRLAPYTNWPAAATNIQDAIDAADPGDLVLLTNGLYQTGGAVAKKDFTTNRVALTKPITVQSVNGPAVTTILGVHADFRLSIPPVRCAFLTNGATLIGFTLTSSQAGSSGAGGVACALSSGPAAAPTAVISNCLLTGGLSTRGGAAYGLVLHNCTVTGNAARKGGGAYDCILNDCVISNNVANGDQPTFPPPGYGGGAYRCTLNGCLITANTATQVGGGAYQSYMTNCLINANSRTPDIGMKSHCVVFRSFDPENAIRVRGFCPCDALHTQRLLTHSAEELLSISRKPSVCQEV